MTGLVGLFLGLLAGWKLADRFQVVVAVLVPFQLVLLIQTVGIALGKGVSAPDTVDDAAYYVVQVLILSFVLGIALQLSALRFGRAATQPVGRAFAVALIGNLGFVALTLALFEFAHSVVDPGSTAHHSAGGPPIAGMIGILLTVLICIGLGCVTLGRRRSAAAQHASLPRQEA